MSIIRWNCQGLGSGLNVPYLNDLVRKHHPTVVFHMETKNKTVWCERKRKTKGFENNFYVVTGEIERASDLVD